jgi:hypothetical protein
MCNCPRFGNLDVLKWAREHHCPWDETTCGFAARCAPLEVLRWAIDHGAPGNPGESEWYGHLLRGIPHAMDHLRVYTAE